MKIWVDADACPQVIKKILFKAAERTKTNLILVANQYIKTPPSRLISFIQVPQGFDVADNEIVKRIEADDLVITSDIPLADEVIEKGAIALNPRGLLYNKENIKNRLNIRNMMETLRSSGIETSHIPPMNQQDRQKFANQLDQILVKLNQ